MEYNPPPLFNQGAPARVKVIVLALISIALLIIDHRMHSLTLIRQIIGTTLYPLQTIALTPRDAAYKVGGYFSSLSVLQKEIKSLKSERISNAQALQQAQQFTVENAHLRNLFASRERVPVKSIMAEILYDTRDAFTRKIVIDRGMRSGVIPGQPVIDDIGVVGQVTRAFPLTSEVTLLSDKDQAIPVQVVRNGLRSIAYGGGQSGLLDLHFMAANSDIKIGDLLVTSGIDGVYPPGLAVAKVVQVESSAAGVFGRIACQPLAGIDKNRQLLILLADMNTPPRPADEAVKEKIVRKHGKDSPNEAVK